MRVNFQLLFGLLISAAWLATPPAQARESSYSISLDAFATPRYAGSDSTAFAVMPGFRADFGNGFFIDPTKGGAGYSHAFSNRIFATTAVTYDPGRADYNRYAQPGSDELAGMGKIKGSILGGFTVGARLWSATEASVIILLPMTNTERGWSGTAKLVFPVYARDASTVTVVPSVNFGSRKNTQTYFGVTPLQSQQSGFAPYSPSGGIQSATFSAIYSHTVSRNWAVRAAAGVSQLLGDAKDSPIVKRSLNYSGGVGLIYSF